MRNKVNDHHPQYHLNIKTICQRKTYGTLSCKVHTTTSGPISYQTLREPSSRCGDLTSFTYCTPTVATRLYAHLHLTDACLRGSTVVNHLPTADLRSYARNTTVFHNLLQTSASRSRVRAIEIRQTLISDLAHPSSFHQPRCRSRTTGAFSKRHRPFCHSPNTHTQARWGWFAARVDF